MYVCPDCKTLLKDLFCSTCAHQYAQVDGIPVLFSKEREYEAGIGIGAVYDKTYEVHTSPWEDQGRDPKFIQYFSGLLRQFSAGRILEVGCGEGHLLGAIRADEKYAIDISIQGLRKAKTHATAECSAAVAERLPFPSESMDLATSVGVMEHFLDDRAANREIHRVLKPGGRYVALIHVRMSFRERVAQKIFEYVFPRFRPLALFEYLIKKILRPIKQPIQRHYTVEDARACLEECGFRVDRVIRKETDPEVPLIGSHVVIYIAEK